MNILIDDGLSSLSNFTGIGQHGYNIYKHLGHYCEREITNYWMLKYVPRVLRRFLYVVITNFHLFYKKFDIIHYQNQNVPFTKGRNKKVVTIHDLGVFRYPETIPTFYVKYNQLSIENSIKRADAIITPSEFTQNEILYYFPNIDKQKINVCEPGLRDIFFKKNINSDVLQRNGLLPGSYFFFLGSLSRRKNLRFLLNIFLKAKKEKKINPDSQLVLTGQKWWGAKDLNEVINCENGIKNLGFLNDNDVITLYKNSKCFIFPSIYEGFGMPIIEAVSQKIPIIISNIPTSISLNKRHNEQMISFELNNEESLSNALSYVDNNFDIIKKDLNYGDFTIYDYKNVAKKHFDIYKSIL